MSRPSLTDKNARITCGGSIMKVTIAPVTEVWGLKNWLWTLRLSKCYSFFRSMDFEEIMNITERHIFNKFTDAHVFKIMDSVEAVKVKQRILYKLKDKIWDSADFDLLAALKELGRVLPHQFEPLLGPIPTLFVEVMQLAWFEVHGIKPKSLKDECHHLFYMLCLRGELSDSFMEFDKGYLKKWRVAYQDERRLKKQIARQRRK